MHAFPAEVCER